MPQKGPLIKIPKANGKKTMKRRVFPLLNENLV